MQYVCRAGGFYDNAMMESLWATLKKKLVQYAKFRTRAQARSSIFEWIEVWYQRERSHSSLGYLSPEQFETARRVGSYDCVSTEGGEVHLAATHGQQDAEEHKFCSHFPWRGLAASAA